MAEPRVLQFLGTSTGGIRRHVTYLAGQLRDAGIDVDIAGPAGVVDELDHVVPVPFGLRPDGLVRARRALGRLVGDYDLVHAHALKPGWIAASVAGPGRPGPALVLSIHNVVLPEVAGRSTPVLRRLERRLPARVDRSIAVSGEIAERFSGLPGGDRIDVIPPAGPPPVPTRSAAEVRARLGVAEDEDLVVTPARLTPQKDLDLLIDVAAIAVRERPKLRWFVFGEGRLRPHLEARVAQLGLEQVVRFPGLLPSVDDELAAADAVAITSRWESGPLVVLEALALGRPVVSTRVGLVPDAVRPPHGHVVDVGDSVAFAGALVRTLSGGGVDGPGEPPAELAPAALASRVADVYRAVLGAR